MRGLEQGLPGVWDGLVAASPDLDFFCTSTAWALSAREAYAPRSEVRTLANAGAAVALIRTPLDGGGHLLSGMDVVWGFASPVVGPDVARGAALVVEVLATAGRRWDVAALTGLDPASSRYATVVRELAPRYELRRGPAMVRCRIDLGDSGAEGVLARRSPTFRRTFRQAQRRADAAGVSVELIRGGGAQLIDRCRAVDRHSWKGHQGVGLVEDAMFAFYAAMARRFEPTGGLRAGFAQIDGVDVGYILGAVHGGTYRGFQLSYDAAHARLSIGNLLQYAQIHALEAEPVTLYDLGMDMPYKRRWADTTFTTEALVVLRK